jgi:hypothetical protein
MCTEGACNHRPLLTAIWLMRNGTCRAQAGAQLECEGAVAERNILQERYLRKALIGGGSVLLLALFAYAVRVAWSKSHARSSLYVPNLS